ncbi:MAG: dihydrodipicolinate synthase family protein [Planctomycetales bacterium]|nr:dihydrodipicolinate synthase family protein [Planctomycetales bacterium]
MADSELVSRLHGVIPPLATPLRNGRLDTLGLERLIEYVLCAPVNGLFVLGTTGEGPALPSRVRRQVVQESVPIVNGRLPVIVGVSDSSLADAIESAEFAAAVGADAIAATPPYYFPLSQAGLVQWYSELANGSPLPLLLYNFPFLAKSHLELETVARLMDVDNIIGIKDSHGDLDTFAKFCEQSRQREDWRVFIGPEEKLADAIALGADGGVCGGANLRPQLFVDFYEAALAARQAEAGGKDAAQKRVEDVRRAVLQLAADTYGSPISCESVIRGLKRKLAEAGICSAESTWDAPFASRVTSTQ